MNGSKALLAGVAVCAGFSWTATAAAAGRSDLVHAALNAGQAYQTGEMLVQFMPGATASERRAALHAFGASQTELVAGSHRRADGKGDLALVRLGPGAIMSDAVRGLESRKAVEFAEPNWIYQHDAVSNDPYVTNGSLWGMYGDASTPANQYGSQVAEAWKLPLSDPGHTACSGVYVGIIDEGFMYSHEDLAANSGNPNEMPGNGKDDDGNGYVDDTYGWDFVDNNNSTFDGASDDHGTHVAGTIGAVGGNGKGVAGVCWSGIKMISAKFLGRRGGTTANAIKAVDYMTALRNRNVNLVAINNSWGGGGFSQALSDAIGRAGAANIVFVAAAGNESTNNDATPHYPSSYANSNIVSVASITSTGALSSFSNWGATSVDIGAPGSSIWSTVPKSSKGSVVSGYASYSGTSMATPHVTGAIALYAASNPGASVSSIISALDGSGVATPSLAGKTTSGERLNASGF